MNKNYSEHFPEVSILSKKVQENPKESFGDLMVEKDKDRENVEEIERMEVRE